MKIRHWYFQQELSPSFMMNNEFGGCVYLRQMK